MLPLGRRPVLHHVVSELATAGVIEFQMITSERTSAIERYFAEDTELDPVLSRAGLPAGWTAGDQSLSKLTFQYVRQERPLGISDAVHQARSFVHDAPFFLHMGDSVITGDPELLDRMSDVHQRNSAVCTIAIQRTSIERIKSHATIIPLGDPSSEAFEIEEIIEKPYVHEIAVPACVVGRYLISAPMLEVAQSSEPRHSPFGSLGAIFSEREKLTGPVMAVWCKPGARLHDVGTLDDYLCAQAFFALHDERIGQQMRDLLAE
jgi:UTP--glucose-1-phosphate uridylyltransferase